MANDELPANDEYWSFETISNSAYEKAIGIGTFAVGGTASFLGKNVTLGKTGAPPNPQLVAKSVAMNISGVKLLTNYLNIPAIIAKPVVKGLSTYILGGDIKKSLEKAKDSFVDTLAADIGISGRAEATINAAVTASFASFTGPAAPIIGYALGKVASGVAKGITRRIVDRATNTEKRQILQPSKSTSTKTLGISRPKFKPKNRYKRIKKNNTK